MRRVKAIIAKGKARQKTMNEDHRYDRVSQESQFNKYNHNYISRALAWNQTQSIEPQNYKFNNVYSYFKGKAYETRYSFTQRNTDRL